MSYFFSPAPALNLKHHRRAGNGAAFVGYKTGTPNPLTLSCTPRGHRIPSPFHRGDEKRGDSGGTRQRVGFIGVGGTARRAVPPGALGWCVRHRGTCSAGWGAGGGGTVPCAPSRCWGPRGGVEVDRTWGCGVGAGGADGCGARCSGAGRPCCAAAIRVLFLSSIIVGRWEKWGVGDASHVKDQKGA